MVLTFERQKMKTLLIPDAQTWCSFEIFELFLTFAITFFELLLCKSAIFIKDKQHMLRFLARLSEIFLYNNSQSHDEIIQKKQKEMKMRQNFVKLQARMQATDENLKKFEVCDPLIQNHYWRLHLKDLKVCGKKRDLSVVSTVVIFKNLCRSYFCSLII